MTLQLTTLTKDLSQPDVHSKNAGFLLAYRNYDLNPISINVEETPDSNYSFETNVTTVNKKTVNIDMNWSTLGAKIMQTDINSFVWAKILLQEIDNFPFEMDNRKTRMQEIAKYLSVVSQNYRPEVFDLKYLELTNKILESKFSFPYFTDVESGFQMTTSFIRAG